MKNDLEVQKDVMDEIKCEPSLNSANIGVTVTDAEVTLSGWVAYLNEKMTTEKAAKRVAGVKAVTNNLRVALSVHQKEDKELESAIKEIFKWHSEVEKDNVKFKVEEGVVTLTGEVEWEYQRKAIISVVSKLIGVKAIINHIKILPTISSDDLGQGIKEAMVRNANLDAEKIMVSIDGGKVLLKGKVRSFAQSEDAEDIAWAAPGVLSVENKLEVEELNNNF